MKGKYLFGAGAAALAFVIVIGIRLAAAVGPPPLPCQYLSGPCNTWGVVNPQVQGYCCIWDHNGVGICGTGVMSVTGTVTMSCGHIQKIQNNTCSGTTPNIGCGGYQGIPGCISGNCPHGGG